MAQVYSAQAYSKFPQPPPAGPSRRHPLTNAVNHPQNINVKQDPLKAQEKPKQPPSPPLPRQNAKITPPSPPKVINDLTGRFQFNRVGFLGEGGFARVYEVQDRNHTRIACKVVTKSSLKTKKAKTKLYAEIKIHRSLEHPNIVRFNDCFEDEENVYMTLELCASGSLMDMLRRRRRFTEPEARFFMVQLIGACHYMHTHQVIHRDLKLGNLFLDSNMNIKVGDFGLAALIENPGERKKTICGTPNYIAPEVLFDTANGHSFEVDTWSIGVILYTLVVGRPPFQTSEVKDIYKRIRDNEYEFPVGRMPSSNAQHLIQQILTPDPSMRPSLHEIIEHPFFIHGPVPAYIPSSAHDTPPDFSHITRSMSLTNLRRLRRYCMLDEDQVTSIALPKPEANNSASAPSTGTSTTGVVLNKTITTSIAQQEKEFQKAVQPGSPISVLLSSARQPLLMGNNGTGGSGGARDSPLLRKLQAAKGGSSPLGNRRATAHVAGKASALNGIAENGVAVGGTRLRDEQQEEEARLRKKELEAQKARIVAQMAPVREEEEFGIPGAWNADKNYKEKDKDKATLREKERLKSRVADRENVPPQSGHQQYSSTHAKVKEREYAPSSSYPSQAAPSGPTSLTKMSGFDAAAHVLTLAFDAKAVGKLFRDPRDDITLPLPDEKVFIVSWVDYCNKYGMGYALTDGTVGVHFNDSTSLVLSPDKQHMDYITCRRQGTVYVRKSYTVDTYPEDLKSKVYLLKHFEGYIMNRLYGEYEYTFEDVIRTKGMEWVQKYLRMKHVIVFKLSHDVLQFNFYDHSKVILSSHGLMITHIDKNYKMTRWTLSEVMALALKPPAALHDVEPERVKFNQRLVDKLKYCKEVLVSIQSAAGGDELGGSQTAGSAVAMAPATAAGVNMIASAAASLGVSTRASKPSLR